MLFPLLLLLATTFVAHAAPTRDPDAIRIPLQKRFSVGGHTLKDSSGQIDNVVLKAMVDQVVQKYATGAREYHTRTGQSLPGYNANTIRRNLAKRQAEPLTAFLNNGAWGGPMTVGTPPQDFIIDFDTGSSDFWIPGPSISTLTGNNYSPNASTTSVATSSSFTIRYGDESTASGPVVRDTVTVAGVTATNQSLAYTTTETGFEDSPYDGILGMGYQTISQIGAPPVFQTMFSQSAVPKNLFSFKLANTGSELYLGGTNSALYTGLIQYTPVVQQAYWMVRGGTQVNGTTVNTAQNYIMDTGTTLILGPPAAVAQFWAAVPSARPCTVFAECQGYYLIPCTTLDALSVQWTFAGIRRAYQVVHGDFFNFGRYPFTNSQTCLGGIVGVDIGINAWVVGDVFLESVYTVFNFGTNSVGFATLA